MQRLLSLFHQVLSYSLGSPLSFNQHANLTVVTTMHSLFLLTVFTLGTNSIHAFPYPNISSSPYTYTYKGCFSEPLSERALPSALFAYDSMTVESCAHNCNGACNYWGLEYGREVVHLSFSLSPFFTQFSLSPHHLLIQTAKVLVRKHPLSPLPSSPRIRLLPPVRRKCVRDLRRQ